MGWDGEQDIVNDIKEQSDSEDDSPFALCTA
jgi:hypothetical protein